MKERLKAILASAFAFALAFSMAMPAYAASTGTGGTYKADKGTSSTSSLVVATANKGDELGAYQVISINYKDDGTLDYQFTNDFNKFLDSDEYKAYTGAGGKEIKSVDDYKSLTSTKKDETGDLPNLLGAYTKYVKANNVAPKYKVEDAADGTEDGSITFPNVDKGQYIIVGLGNTNGALVYQTVTGEVEPSVVNNEYVLNDTYKVDMKTTQPTPDKTITGGTTDDQGKQTVSVGDIVSYEISATVPTYPAGTTNSTFYMKDTLSAGLTLKSTADDIVVKGDGTTLVKDTDYTVTIDGQTLYIDLKYDNVKQYQKITAAYDAVLNEHAVTGTAAGNPNTYTLVWSNNPYSGETSTSHPSGPGYGTGEDQETVYTYALKISKYKDGDESTKLPGATFQIKDSDRNVIAEITTDENGNAAYSGLEKGTYYLHETVAPAGYKKLTKDIEIELSEANATSSVTTTTTTKYTTDASEAKFPVQATNANGTPLWLPKGAAKGTAPTASATQPAGDYVPAYVLSVTTTVTSNSGQGTAAQGYFEQGVANAPGTNLPTTGGMGTTILYIIGGALVLGAAVCAITRKRISNRAK